MAEKYITKEKDVLTRVTLSVEDGNDYIVESVYSDDSLLELSMLCIEAYLTDLNISKDYLCKTIKKVLNDKGKPKKSKLTRFFQNILKRKTTFRFIFEQYDKRNIVKSKDGADIVSKLIFSFRSCSVLSTWLPETVDDFLTEYVEEYEQYQGKPIVMAPKDEDYLP